MANKENEFTKWAEGLRLKPYVCPAGKLTIGYGRNLDDVGISEEEANFMIENDLDKVDDLMRKHYPTVLQYQHLWKNVYRDLIFNMGPKKFATMKKFINAVDQRNYCEALAELVDSNWFNQVGYRSKAIFNSVWKGSDPSSYLEFTKGNRATIDKDFRQCFAKWLKWHDCGRKTNFELYGKRPRIAKWIKAFGL